MFSQCREALPLVSLEACPAEGPGKQFIQFPRADGDTGRIHSSLWELERCLAVTGPGMSFMPMCFVRNHFPSRRESPFPIEVFQTVQEP